MIAGSALETPECLLGQIKITFAIKKKKQSPLSSEHIHHNLIKLSSNFSQ